MAKLDTGYRLDTSGQKFRPSVFSGLGTISLSELEVLSQRYGDADPFPHLVIDNLFSPQFLSEIEAEFDTLNNADWNVFRHGLQTKRATRYNSPLPAATQEYFDQIYSGPFIRFLSKVTGIQNLISDPLLSGGGMHEIPRGGAFDIHVDFQKHPQNGLNNRLAVITYLNKDWRPEYGGALELWRQNPVECVAKVIPTFGRTIIMEESMRGSHGHPDPINAPEGKLRRSILAYFYTNGRDDGLGGDGLKTLYTKRGGRSLRQNAELMAQQLLPPIVVSACKVAMQQVWKK